jgi:serine/threonine-protein kinase
VSAALAAVVEAATAKRLEDRYADDAELIADLEDVLAIETARAGSVTGEVTSVLRTLPSGTQRRVPFFVRHRRLMAAAGLVLAVVAIGLAVWLGTRAHHGAGKLDQPPPARGLVQVEPCQNCANAYNPDGLNGDTSQNNQTAGLAIDGNLGTAWTTEQYYSGQLGKPGVGLYLDVSSGGGTAAKKLVIHTTTPGFAATIEATNKTPSATSFTASGWVPVGSAASVASRQDISLSSGHTRYRYYLVWITKLPSTSNSVSLDEVTLYR